MATTANDEDVKSEDLDEELETGAEAQEDETSTGDEETEDDDTEESEDDDSEEDESDEDSETDEEDESEFKKRFTQFKGDSYEEYVPELEKAHGNLLAELTRVKQSAKDDKAELDKIRSLVENDPKLKEKLEGTSAVAVDPALLKARQDMEEQWEKDHKEFSESHPEYADDPQVQETILKHVKDLGTLARNDGKILSMKEALNKAWIIAGYNDDSSEKVAAKAKEVASKPATSSKKKKGDKKPQFSEEQIRMAKKFGLTPEQLASANK